MINIFNGENAQLNPITSHEKEEFKKYYEELIVKSKDKLTISKNNKLEAVILDIEEYERLQNAYDLLEQKEIEILLLNRPNEDKVQKTDELGHQ